MNFHIPTNNIAILNAVRSVFLESNDSAFKSLEKLYWQAVEDAGAAITPTFERMELRINHLVQENAQRFDWIKSAFINHRRIAAPIRLQNWIVACNLFGCGRTKAIEFCQHMNIDPDGFDLGAIQ